MAQHFQGVRKLFSNAEKSSTFAKHFGNRSHWPNLAPGEIPSPQHLRKIIKFDVLYRGNPLGTVRTFGTKSCRICMKERLEILKHSYDWKVKLINSRSEIYGTCMHKPDFHRFGADEASQAEKVVLDLSAEKNGNSNNSVISGNTYINMCIPINLFPTFNNDQTIQV